MYFMDPEIGHIDSAENWKTEILSLGVNLVESERQYASLIQVVKVNGEWVEAV